MSGMSTGSNRKPGAPAGIDAVNAALRRRLLDEGSAVVGRADLGRPAAVHLKLTLLNPAATVRDVEALLALVVAAGRNEEAVYSDVLTGV